MNECLKVRYVTGSIEVTRNMNQLQLSELLQDQDIILLSVNEKNVQRSFKKKKRGKQEK